METYNVSYLELGREGFDVQREEVGGGVERKRKAVLPFLDPIISHPDPAVI